MLETERSRRTCVYTDAGGVDDAASRVDDGGSPPSSTSVLLVTELIRLTVKKLQTALAENRIHDDDLVAMAMAVDAGAVMAALNARRDDTATNTAAAGPKTAASPEQRASDIVAFSTTSSASRFGSAQFAHSTSTDRPWTYMTGEQDSIDILSSREISAAAKKVLSDAMSNLTE